MCLTQASCLNINFNKQENNIYYLILILAKMYTKVNLEILVCH